MQAVQIAQGLCSPNGALYLGEDLWPQQRTDCRAVTKTYPVLDAQRTMGMELGHLPGWGGVPEHSPKDENLTT